AIPGTTNQAWYFQAIPSKINSFKAIPGNSRQENSRQLQAGQFQARQFQKIPEKAIS
ncbi:hypothetical protein P7K49_017423, partial [Saguinus oedipus]